MLSSVGESNNVQRFAAVNALRSNAKISRPEQESADNISELSGTKAAPKTLLERVDVADIRKFASYVGENNISDDEIKYGLMYGRSVIAEFLC